MRSNLIGHTIFLTSEKHRMTNQKPDTIFLQVRTSVSVFPAFRGGHARVNVCNVPCCTRIMASKFAGVNSVEQFIEDQENEIQERKLNRMLLCLKTLCHLPWCFAHCLLSSVLTDRNSYSWVARDVIIFENSKLESHQSYYLHQARERVNLYLSTTFQRRNMLRLKAGTF